MEEIKINENDNNKMQENEKEEQNNYFEKDQKIIENILKSMKIENYESRIILMLQEFMYKYVTEILQDAQIYSGNKLLLYYLYIKKKSMQIEIKLKM